MKQISIIGNILSISGGLLFFTSFFVEDNHKAINRRYLATGLLLGGGVIKLSVSKTFNKSSVK